jgi:hypothetical protein
MLNFLIIFLLSAAAFANECSTVDLRLTGKLTQEVRNQGRMSWCYAHTAVDLVQYHFNSPSLSAADFAIQYSNHFAAKLVHSLMNISTLISSRPTIYMEPQTGFIKASLNQGFQEGFCPRNIFPDEKIKLQSLRTGDSKEVDFATAMFDILKNLQPEIKSGFSFRENIYRFPGLSDDNFFSILKDQSRQKVFDTISGSLCRDHRLNFQKPKITQKVRSANMFTTIDQQLDSANIVAFDYNADVLNDKLKASIVPKSLHTSSIVGRRWNVDNQSCEYLVRNSFGPECKRYDKSYSCEDGNIWIPQKYLAKSILMITYLE